MALQAAVVQLRQTENLGSKVFDHPHTSSSMRMGETGYVHAADTGYALISDTDHIDSKIISSRYAYRKKSRSKAKQAKKSSEKVFPEELLSDTCKDNEPASLNNTPHEIADKEAISSSTKFSGASVDESNQLPEGKYDAKQNDMQHIQASDCCSTKNNHTVTNSGMFLSTDAKKSRNHLHSMRRKDQSRLTWQRCERDRNVPTERAELSLTGHVNLDCSSQTSSFRCARDEQNIAAYVQKTLDSGENVPYKGTCAEVKVESSLDVGNAKAMTSVHSVDIDKSDANPANFWQGRSSGWRRTRSHGLKWDRCQYRSVPDRTELQQQYPYGAQFDSKDQSTFDVVQPCVWMKWPKAKVVEDNTFNGEWGDVSCLESNTPYRMKRGQDLTQQPGSRKWIPVCKKKVKAPKSTVSVETCEENTTDDASTDDSCFQLEGVVISLSGTDVSSGLESTNLMLTQEISSLAKQDPEIERKNYKVEAQRVELAKEYHQPFHIPEFHHRFIDSRVVEQAFAASYRLQLASESVQQATGYPVAEFERLICSATPFIASSFSSETCDGCLAYQQIPNVSLHAIWNWFEEPGNYGLRINLKEPQNPNGCLADTVSSHAHFVPLLSAVQLFGNSQCSLGIDGTAKLPASHLGNPFITSSLKATLMGCNTANSQAACNASEVCVSDRNDPLSARPPALLSNADLIFEFFESEQPQRRMPLHVKIMELATGGTTNNQVFGDPSKLECTNLNDLHPASWFSVAWYPIYRIPEGKLRAAFLTYHSLGYLPPKRMANDSVDKSTFGVVLPVIGLQSYNTQGDLWFSPNKEVESSFRELTSVLLRERTGVLEENALLFARGMVSKDHSVVTNRQPDYEFFISRKL